MARSFTVSLILRLLHGEEEEEGVTVNNIMRCRTSRRAYCGEEESIDVEVFLFIHDRQTVLCPLWVDDDGPKQYIE